MHEKTNCRIAQFAVVGLLLLLNIFSPVGSDCCYNYLKSDNFAQVAFLFDRSLIQYKPHFIEAITKSLESKRAELWIAVGSYGGFTPGGDWNPGCYLRHHGFTRDEFTLQGAVDAIEESTGGTWSPISSLTFVTMDKDIGWLPGLYTSKGQLIRKLLFFFAESEDDLSPTYDGRLLNEEARVPCKASPLYYGTVRHYLQEYNVTVVGLYKNQQIRRSYELKLYAMGIPYCSAVYGEMTDFPNVARTTLDSCIRELQKCTKDSVLTS